MGSEAFRRIYLLGLFAAGLIFSALGMTAFDNITLWSRDLTSAPLKGVQQPQDTHLTLACTLQEKTDDIFFISCGGIY